MLNQLLWATQYDILETHASFQSVKFGAPLQPFAVDIFGVFSKLVEENSYIQTVGGYFTCWMKVYPLLNDTEGMIGCGKVDQ